MSTDCPLCGADLTGYRSWRCPSCGANRREAFPVPPPPYEPTPRIPEAGDYPQHVTTCKCSHAAAIHGESGRCAVVVCGCAILRPKEASK